MARIALTGVDKVYSGGAKALDNLNIDVSDGEFMVLVGPSGCGKSTALRTIAGLEEITGGTVTIGDRLVNDLPPKDRDIAMVFQNYALYPQKTVAERLNSVFEWDRVRREAIGPLVLQPSRGGSSGPPLFLAQFSVFSCQ